MKYKWKRVLAVVFLFIIVAGWYVTVCGIGPVKPIQDRMKLGLDIKGGVYAVSYTHLKIMKDKLKSYEECRKRYKLGELTSREAAELCGMPQSTFVNWVKRDERQDPNAVSYTHLVPIKKAVVIRAFCIVLA